MNKTISRILILFLLAILIVGIYVLRKRNIYASPEYEISDSTLHLLSNMNNSDVTWTIDYAGFFPMEMTGTTSILKDVEENINPLLVDALLDEDRFLAAHVLLTYRTTTQVLTLVPRNIDEWNGLIFQFDKNGAIIFDIHNMQELQKYWREKLEQ